MKSTSAAIILAAIVYWHVGAQDISELLNAESPLCQTPSEDDLNEQLNVFNKIEDVNDITKINFHGIDWADLLYPAPAAIGVLGSLLSITQKYNPALSEFPFLYVKYPNSLGTSLTEIVRKMHWVFVRSHQDVEQMRHDTTLVPEFFRNIIRIANGEIEDYDMSMIKSVASAYIDPIDGIKNVLLEVEELQLACIQQRKMNTNDSSKVQSLSKTIEQLGALRVYGRELSHFIKTIFEVVVKRWQNALLNFIDSAMEPEMLGLFPGSNVT
uniref:Uncharacterized protein n=1 Tax=Plectus sambesii TaxID=2011161 RepID=A0A914XJP2_9BILA